MFVEIYDVNIWRIEKFGLTLPHLTLQRAELDRQHSR